MPSFTFLHHPPLEVMHNPTTMHDTQQAQTNDQRLMQKAQADRQRLIICYRNHPKDPNWKIAVPQELIQRLTLWYHLVLRHCGNQWLYNTISRRFHYPGLKKCIAQYNCAVCQRNNNWRKYMNIYMRE